MYERVPGVKSEHAQYYDIGTTEVDMDSLNAFIGRKQPSCANSLQRGCNDLVIALLYAKRTAEALTLSTQLLAKYPEDYNVVITHAAALELSGRPADAIPFMKKAIGLNPDSHRGSEWIHLNLLEQRVRGTVPSDPWSLIGVDLRPDSALMAPDSVDLRQLAKQVHYQVNDRLFFTPANDPLFGALLFAYADLLELCKFRNQAKLARERAASYGFVFQWEPPAAAAPVVEVQPAPPAAVKQEPPAPAGKERTAWGEVFAWSFIGIIVLLVVGFVWRQVRTS